MKTNKNSIIPTVAGLMIFGMYISKELLNICNVYIIFGIGLAFSLMSVLIHYPWKIKK